MQALQWGRDQCHARAAGQVMLTSNPRPARVALRAHDCGSVEEQELETSPLCALCLRSNLEDLGLRGSIPEAGWAGALPAGLQSLDLSSNLISGSLPADLGLPAGLTSLVLANNTLQGYVPGGAGVKRKHL